MINVQASNCKIRLAHKYFVFAEEYPIVFLNKEHVHVLKQILLFQ